MGRAAAVPPPYPGSTGSLQTIPAAAESSSGLSPQYIFPERIELSSQSLPLPGAGLLDIDPTAAASASASASASFASVPPYSSGSGMSGGQFDHASNAWKSWAETWRTYSSPDGDGDQSSTVGMVSPGTETVSVASSQEIASSIDPTGSATLDAIPHERSNSVPAGMCFDTAVSPPTTTSEQQYHQLTRPDLEQSFPF